MDKNKQHMNKYQHANKASVSQMQSSMFMSHLQKEMGKLASEYKKGSLVKAAHQYVQDGMTIHETKELLQIDGYDPILVEAYVNNIGQDEFAQDTMPKWGFDVEDVYGRIYASVDLNLTVKANTKDDAWQQAEEEVDKMSSSGLDRIIDVYQI